MEQADTNDRVHIGGLMRCCLDTIDDLYPDGPAKVAREGQELHCKYAPDDDTHKMIFRHGCWQWDHEAEPDV